MHKSFMRRILFLLIAILIVSCWSLIQASAATYEITSVHVPRSNSNVLVGYSNSKGTGIGNIIVENVDNPDDWYYFDGEGCTLTSSNPEVLTVELYSYPNTTFGGLYYGVKVEALSPGTATVTLSNPEKNILSENVIHVLDPAKFYWEYAKVSDDLMMYSNTTEEHVQDEITVKKENITAVVNDESFDMVSSNNEIVEVECVPENDGTDSVHYNLHAKMPGTATITITGKAGSVIEGCTKSFSVTVFDSNLLSWVRPLEKYTIKKTENIDIDFICLFGRDGSVIADKKFSVGAESFDMVSSNPKVVKVDQEAESRYSLVGLKAGTATITVTVNADSGEDLAGMTKTFKVTVTEAKAKTPVLYKQINANTEVYYDGIDVCFGIIKDEYVEYQIYRSTSPNKNFKKIKTVRVKDYGSFYDWYQDDYYYLFKDKKVKSNKKYYYKVRARYYNKENSNKWSAFTKAKAYWTAPKPVKNFKYNKKTRKLTIPKVKNVAGYVYDVHSSRRLGYNIFGGAVLWIEDATRITKKRNITVKILDTKSAYQTVEYVTPYAKHGKYYYMNDKKPMKNINKVKTHTSDKRGLKY